MKEQHDTARAAFEANWCERNHPVPLNSRLRDDGRYGDHRIQSEWEAWQASAARAPAESVGAGCDTVRAFPRSTGLGHGLRTRDSRAAVGPDARVDGQSVRQPRKPPERQTMTDKVLKCSPCPGTQRNSLGAQK